MEKGPKDGTTGFLSPMVIIYSREFKDEQYNQLSSEKLLLHIASKQVNGYLGPGARLW